MAALGLKSGRKYVEKFSPVPEDNISPVGRSRSSSGSLFRRVRSFRDSSSSKERDKEKAAQASSRRPQSPDTTTVSSYRRSTSASAGRTNKTGTKSSSSNYLKESKSRSGSSGGSTSSSLRSVSSSPNRSKVRSTLGVGVDPYAHMRPMSPMGRPVKSSMKKSNSPTRSSNRSVSPTAPLRSKSTERKGSGNVFSRLYPGSGGGGQEADEGISDSRFHGVNDTLRIRKKKDSNKATVVDFDGAVTNSPGGGKSSRQSGQSGQDEHDFVEILVSAPLWCDRCGAFIWGLYKHAVKCKKCSLTCHKKCSVGIRLECNATVVQDSLQDRTGTPPPPMKNGQFSELVDSVEVTQLRMKSGGGGGGGGRKGSQQDGYATVEQRHAIQQRIACYNHRQTPAHQLKFADLSTDFQGFVRVHMCVTRPIHVSAGVTKNSWYGLMKPVRAKPKKFKGKNKQKKADSGIECGDNETTFYLPTDANRLVHISNTTSTLELISILLKKFCVTDHPNKFALFEEHKGDTRRLFNEECPLEVLVDSAAETRFSKLVLRDNVDGSIQWSGFSLPELHNFTIMLSREEDIHIKELRDKFTTWKRVLMDVMQEKCMEEADKAERKREVFESRLQTIP